MIADEYAAANASMLHVL